MTTRVALLIDGDNISAAHADRLCQLARCRGRVDIARVYANGEMTPKWLANECFGFHHSGSGKNATDMLLAIDAIELALRDAADTFVIASSDRDFVPLARRLRELNCEVIGVGESKACSVLREIYSDFVELEPLTPEASNVTALDRQIRQTIANNSRSGSGMPICDLNLRMRADHDVLISTFPEKNWRGYLSARPELYELDPKGPDAHVRFRRQGFSLAAE